MAFNAISIIWFFITRFWKLFVFIWLIWNLIASVCWFFGVVVSDVPFVFLSWLLDGACDLGSLFFDWLYFFSWLLNGGSCGPYKLLSSCAICSGQIVILLNNTIYSLVLIYCSFCVQLITEMSAEVFGINLRLITLSGVWLVTWLLVDNL